MKNLTARVAWHDNKWNGAYCRDPETNSIYCMDNYSLLGPRIRKRLDLEKEINNRGESVDLLDDYFPPCYWSISVNGNSNLKIKDPHPLKRLSNDVYFDGQLFPHSIYTWCFKLGYGPEIDNEELRNYYNPNLERDIGRFLSQVDPKDSLVFLYANYGNPVSGEARKYLLLGVGKIKNIEPPTNYTDKSEKIKNLTESARNAGPFQYNFKFRNLSNIAWQFRLDLDEKSPILLPYQDILDYYDNFKGEKREELERILDKIAITINESSLLPHFKYVSMQVSQDKSLYLLYELRKKFEIIETELGAIVDPAITRKNIEELDTILSLEWKKRGKFPGIRNLLILQLENLDFPDPFWHEKARKLVTEGEKVLNQYLKNSNTLPVDISGLNIGNDEVRTFIDKILKEKDKFLFLSRFDFSVKQFKKIQKLIDRLSFEKIQENPYLILENYVPEDYQKEDKAQWNDDNLDYDINVFQIDTGLKSDIRFTAYSDFDFRADRPERIRSLIREILINRVDGQGDTYMPRKDIISDLRKYPLYYMNKELDIDDKKLSEYENLETFKEIFDFKKDEANPDEILYRLKTIKGIEDLIESSINTVLKKNYPLLPETELRCLLDREPKELKNKFDGFEKKEREHIIKERESIYRGIWQNGLFILSGKAGSGKTSAIVNFASYVIQKKLGQIIILTPTGRSNLIIKERLEKELKDKFNDEKLIISTIHRFLWDAPFRDIPGGKDQGKRLYRQSLYQNGHEFLKLLQNFLDKSDSPIDTLSSMIKHGKQVCKSPKFLIIDESSMIDEKLLASLLTLVNTNRLEHLVLAGDEKQLPPIGIGRPFIDIINYVRMKNAEKNYLRLSTNYRYDERSAVKDLASLFEFDDDINYSIYRLTEILTANNNQNSNLSVSYYRDDRDLTKLINDLISKELSTSNDSRATGIKDNFARLFEPNNKEGEYDLEKLQILVPKRYGQFGSAHINNLILGKGYRKTYAETKIIYEKNEYKEQDGKRDLVVTNGSLGFIDKNGKIYMKEVEHYFKDRLGDKREKEKFLSDIKDEFDKEDSSVSPGYAITVHKSQGTDYDNVIFIISDFTRFLSKELFYTAVTRVKKRVNIFIKDELREKIEELSNSILNNSFNDSKRTLLFQQNAASTKMFTVHLADGRTILTRSKIEKIIAEELDRLNVQFEYEPQDLKEFKMIPDFKISVNGRSFILEHLGFPDDYTYMTRWKQKKAKYEEIGFKDFLITTSESKESKDQRSVIEQLVNTLTTGRPGGEINRFSDHHFYL